MLESCLNVQTYSVGSGAVFPFNVPFFAATDIHCYFQAGDAEEIELVNGTDFTVEAKDNYSSGADITLAAKYVISGATLAIAREVPELQTLSLPTNGKLPSKPMETQLDRHVAMIQALREMLSRAAVLPITYLGSGGAIDPNTIINKYVSGTLARILGDYFYSSGTAIFNRYISSGGITTIALHDKALFEIFPAAATEKPQGAEKLDGTVLYNCADPESLYYNFYQKALEYARDGKISAVTQAQYAATIAQYGQCGSFVVDDIIDGSPHSIKLPTVNGFIQNGTPGVVHNAGLPNILGTLPEVVGTSRGANPTGAFSFGSATGRYDDFEGGGNHPTFEAIFNAAAGNSAFGTADTVQPRSVEMCFFIQVSDALGRTIPGVGGSYLPISGGTITGNLDVEGFFTANGGGYIREVNTTTETKWALPSGGAFSATYLFSGAQVANGGAWYLNATTSTTISSEGAASGAYVNSGYWGEDVEEADSITVWTASNTPTFTIDSATGYITAALWGGSAVIPPENGTFLLSSIVSSTYYDDALETEVTLNTTRTLSGAIVAVNVGTGTTESGTLVQPVSGGMVLSSWEKHGSTLMRAEELKVSSGGAYLRTYSSGGEVSKSKLATEDYVNTHAGSGGQASGAWVSGAEFHTIVGSFTLDYGSDGFTISGGGVQLQVSSGVIVASNTETGGFFSLGVGGATIEDGYGGALSVQAGNVGFGGINVTANGDNVATESWAESRFAPRLVTSTDTTNTSASFAELEGGTSFIYTQPISAFDVTNITSECRATMEFTAGADLNLGLPTSVVLFGSSACSSGGHYVVAVNGNWVVVNEGKVLSAGV